MCKQNSAIITATLAAGSIDSPYFVQVTIAQRLCSPACGEQSPVFSPAFSVVGFSEVGATQYVATIKVGGIISYVPCGGNACNTRTQVLSQTFSIPFTSTTAPTSVSVASGVTINTISTVACQSCSRDFISETPLTLTIA